MSRPGIFRAAIVGRHQFSPGILAVSLRRPMGFTFLPGQFVRFLMDGYQRDYTLVSSAQANTLDLCIALVAGGRFSAAIADVPMGTVFQLSGPHGHFIFQSSANPAVFVATGTGIAPFVAFCHAGVRDALLLHGVRETGALVYRSLLQPRLRGYVPCLSRTAVPVEGLETAFAGRVTRYLETLLAPGRYDFYLCGRREMIRDATALIDARFSDSRVFIETYD